MPWISVSSMSALTSSDCIPGRRSMRLVRSSRHCTSTPPAAERAPAAVPASGGSRDAPAMTASAWLLPPSELFEPPSSASSSIRKAAASDLRQPAAGVRHRGRPWMRIKGRM
eukprot:366571-Chlamydomonas_euryale.AAC.24